MEIIDNLSQLTALMAVNTERKPRAVIICTPEGVSRAITILFDAYEAAEVHQANLTIQTEGPWNVYTRAENGVITGQEWNLPPAPAPAPEQEEQPIFKQFLAPQPRQGSAKNSVRRNDQETG